MKPCSQYRKLLALLALPTKQDTSGSDLAPDAFDRCMDQPVKELSEHMKVCPGCRQYFDEVLQVCSALTSSPVLSNIHSTHSLHQRVATAIRAQRTATEPEKLSHANTGILASEIWNALLRVLRTILTARIAVSAVIVLATSILLWWTFFRPSATPLLKSLPNVTTAPANPSPCLLPSVANYQAVANRSLEQFDQLVTSQASRSTAPTPVYTASIVGQPSISD